jgi:hypothetical protein
MPKVGLGIGRYQGVVGGIQQELLTWYDERCDRYLTAEEIAQVQGQRANQEKQRADQLVEYLRSLGIDPDNLPSNS